MGRAFLHYGTSLSVAGPASIHLLSSLTIAVIAIANSVTALAKATQNPLFGSNSVLSR